jgi:hypothetical protein
LASLFIKKDMLLGGFQQAAFGSFKDIPGTRI